MVGYGKVMALETLQVPKQSLLKPRIMIFGVGGAGCNAVNHLISRDLGQIEFVVANTDAQSLEASSAENRIQLGATTTEGLGAGADPNIGRAAAEESIDEIRDAIEGVHLCFITAGMGGGTGTGAAPIIARMAREAGVLTVAVVIKPFEMELAIRMAVAEKGIAELENEVNTLIVIPNENLYQIDNEDIGYFDLLAMANDGLFRAISTISDLITGTGMINRDFADVKSVFNSKGRAMFGFGEAEGEDKGVRAAQEALQNKLVEDTDLERCERVLINVIGGSDMKLSDVHAANQIIQDRVGKDKNLIFGADKNDALQNRIRVTVIATGMPSSTFGRHLDGRTEPIPQPYPGGQDPQQEDSSGAEWEMGPTPGSDYQDEDDSGLAEEPLIDFGDDAADRYGQHQSPGESHDPDVSNGQEAGRNTLSFIAPAPRRT